MSDSNSTHIVVLALKRPFDDGSSAAPGSLKMKNRGVGISIKVGTDCHGPASETTGR
jgi:hypothetical protein